MAYASAVVGMIESACGVRVHGTDLDHRVFSGRGRDGDYSPPPHRSVRAALPHTAPALSYDAKRLCGYGWSTRARGVAIDCADYAAMAGMIFSDVPSFDAVLDTIALVESRVNGELAA